MVTIGGLVLFAGYWLTAYGWGTLRGCNAGFLAYGWPGKWQGCMPDQGNTTAAAPAKSSVPAGTATHANVNGKL